MTGRTVSQLRAVAAAGPERSRKIGPTLVDMTNQRHTAARVATIAVAAVLGGFTLGCGLVQNAVDAA